MSAHNQCSPDIATQALQHYATDYCEGWCRDAPANANFDDCGGCRARLALVAIPDVAQPPAEPVAWLDVRTAGLSWQNRIVATNPQFVENNGPENFVALYAAPSSPAADGAIDPDHMNDQRMLDDMKLADNVRNAVIEECARIADNNGWEATAAQIRALSMTSTHSNTEAR